MFFSTITTLSFVALSTLTDISFAVTVASVTKTAELDLRSEFEARAGSSSYFYRADARTPEQLRQADGLWARGYSPGTSMKRDISLYHHAMGICGSLTSEGDNGYVAFTSDKKVAEGWIKTYLDNEGYIYQVHGYANLINVQETLRKYNPYPEEKEFAAIKGTEWSQVMGWNHYTPNTDARTSQTQPLVKHRYNQNPQYDSRFSGKTDGGAQYALAGFPRDHPAWKEEPWYYYSACAALSNKRDSTSNSTSSNTTCTPIKSNQEFAQEYVDTLAGWAVNGTTNDTTNSTSSN